MNDLRATRGRHLLSENALFTPDLSRAIPDSLRPDPADGHTESARDVARRMRHAYQIGLLAWIRKEGGNAGLERIRDVLDALQQASREDAALRLWWVAGGLAEALLSGLLKPSVSSTLLLGQVDRQIKRLLDEDENVLATDPNTDLLKNLLFYVASAEPGGERVSSIREHYGLAALLPSTEEVAQARDSLSGRNAELMRTVSNAIKEDLTRVKDGLDVFLRGSQDDPVDLKPLAQLLHQIGDTFGMLGEGASRKIVQEQAAVLEQIVAGESACDEGSLMEVASALLVADARLAAMSGPGAYAPAAPAGGTQASGLPEADYSQILGVVAQEAVADLSRAKDAIVGCIDGSWDFEQLESVPGLLHQIKGGLMLLGEDYAAAIVDAVTDYVGKELLDAKQIPAEHQLDTLADSISSIEYYLEDLKENRIFSASVLDVAASSLERLGYPVTAPTTVGLAEGADVQEQDGGEQDSAHLSGPEEIVLEPPQFADVDGVSEEATSDEDLEVEDIELSAVPAGLDDGESADLTEPNTPAFSGPDPEDSSVPEEQVAASPEPSAVSATTPNLVLAEDVDDEILGIFIEEAEEEYASIAEQFPRWRDNPDDGDALSTMRRSYHTLKGSGRLVGAVGIGEFAWAFENMLNRLIDGSITTGGAMFALVEHGIKALRELIDQISNGRDPAMNIQALMDCADALSRGDSVSMDEIAAASLPGSSPSIQPADADGSAEQSTAQDDAPQPVDADAAMDPVLFEIFYSETRGHTATIREFIDGCRGQTGACKVTEPLVRALHTLHGSARMAGADGVAGLASELEKYAKALMVEQLPIPSAGIAALEEAANVVEDVVFRIGQGGVDVPDCTQMREHIADLPRTRSDAGDDSDGPYVEYDFGLEFSEDEKALGLLSDQDSPVADGLVTGQSVEEMAAEDTASSAPDAPLSLESDSDPGQERDEGGAEFGAEPLVFGEPETPPTYAEHADAAVEDWEHPGDAETDHGAAAIDESTGNWWEEAVHDDGQEVPAEETASALAVPVGGESPGEADPSAHFPGERPDERPVPAAEPEEAEAGVPGGGSLADPDLAGEDAIAEPDSGPEHLVSAGGDTTLAEPYEEAPRPVADDETDVGATGDDEDSELVEIFLEEGDEILENIELTLHNWIRDPDRTEFMHALQRDLHTLKGGARMAGIQALGDLSHGLESLLNRVVDGHVPVSKRLYDLLQIAQDRLVQMIEQVRRHHTVEPAAGLIQELEDLQTGAVAESLSEPVVTEAPAIEPDLVPEDYGQTARELPAAAGAELPAETPEIVEVETIADHPDRRAASRVQQELVRVRADLLDNLVNYAGEISIYRARLEQQVGAFGFNLVEFDQTVSRLREQLRKLEIETEAQILFRYEREAVEESQEDFDPLELDRYSQLQQLSRSLMESVSDLSSIQGLLANNARESETLLLQQSRVNTELQEGLMRTRMVPFARLAPRLRRIVRQTCQALGKEAELTLEGAEGEMDRTVIDRIMPPLEHMLRNAISHGIEMPERRTAAGKPAMGQIRISLARDASDVVIRIADDGAGMDLAAIRRKALECGLLAPGTEPSDHDIMQFVLETGFSTAEEITQVAGRGVGMDVVNSEVKQLGGSLEIGSSYGTGTVFTIRLPFTLAINQALLVQAAEENFAIPLTSIEGIVRMSREDLARYLDDAESMFEYAAHSYRVQQLADLLGAAPGQGAPASRSVPVLLVRSGEHRLALAVDTLMGSREIVVKSVGPQLSTVRAISGATILGDGRVVLILDLGALVRAGGVAQQISDMEADKAANEPGVVTVMVVDDSITVRKITARLLERNNMNVITAKDGVDAVTKLQEQLPDVMLLDIEMPRMDGFELATHVRNEERLRQIPMIMITSRTGDKHRKRAMEIGVERYLGKPYQESELLDSISGVLSERGADA
ncbi:MAG: Hpt domain-containing protein [Gammaproteobacteria bacterium]